MFRSRWAVTRTRSRSRSKRQTEQQQQQEQEKDETQANVRPLELLPHPAIAPPSGIPSSPATIHGFPSYEQQQWEFGLSTTPPAHHYHHARPCHSVQDLLLIRDEAYDERWGSSHNFNALSPPHTNGSPPLTTTMNKKKSLPVLPPLPSVSPFGTTPPRGSSSATGYGHGGSPGVDMGSQASPRMGMGTPLASSPLPPEQPVDTQQPSSNKETAMQLSINAQGHMSIHAAPDSTPVHQHHPMASVDSTASPTIGTGFALNKTLPPEDTTARCSGGVHATLSSRLEQKTKKFLSKFTKSPVLRRFGAKGSTSSQEQEEANSTPKGKRSRNNTETLASPLNHRLPAGTTSTLDLPGTTTSLSSVGGGAAAVNGATNSRRKIGRKGSAQGTTLSTSSISLPLHLVAVPHPNPQWQRMSTRNDSRLSMLQVGAASEEHREHGMQGDTRPVGVARRQSRVSLASIQTTLTHDARALPASPAQFPPSPTPPTTSRTCGSPSTTMPAQWKRDSIRGNMDYYRPGSASKRVEMGRGSLSVVSGPSCSQQDTQRVTVQEGHRLPSCSGSTPNGQRGPSRDGRSHDGQRVPSRSGPTPSQRLPSRGSARELSPRPNTSHLAHSPPPTPITPRDGSMEVIDSSPSTLHNHRQSGRATQPSPSPSRSRARRDALSPPASSPVPSSLKSRPNSQISVLSSLPAAASGAEDFQVKSAPVSDDLNDEEERMWRSPVTRKSSLDGNGITAPPSSPQRATSTTPSRLLFPTYSAPMGSIQDLKQQTSPTKLPTTWIELEPSNADPSLIETRTSNRQDLYVASQANSTATLAQDMLVTGDSESDSDSGRIVDTADVGFEAFGQAGVTERRAVHPYAYMRHHRHAIAVEEHSHWSADTTSQQSERDSSGGGHEQSNSNSSSDPTSELTVRQPQPQQHQHEGEALRDSIGDDGANDHFNDPRPAPCPPSILNGHPSTADDDGMPWPSSSASSYCRDTKNDALQEHFASVSKEQQHGGVGHYPTHLSSSAHSYVRRPSMQSVSATRSLSPLGPGRNTTASPSGLSSTTTPTPSRMPTPMPWSSVRARASVLSSTSASTATPTRGL